MATLSSRVCWRLPGAAEETFTSCFLTKTTSRYRQHYLKTAGGSMLGQEVTQHTELWVLCLQFIYISYLIINHLFKMLDKVLNVFYVD